MKLYYRGYVIHEDSFRAGCTVENRRPERREVALEDNLRAAMRWVDRDVLRHKVADAGWLTSRLLSA